jgi:hypothetical protein
MGIPFFEGHERFGGGQRPVGDARGGEKRFWLYSQSRSRNAHGSLLVVPALRDDGAGFEDTTTFNRPRWAQDLPAKLVNITPTQVERVEHGVDQFRIVACGTMTFDKGSARG